MRTVKNGLDASVQALLSQMESGLAAQVSAVSTAMGLTAQGQVIPAPAEFTSAARKRQHPSIRVVGRTSVPTPEDGIPGDKAHQLEVVYSVVGSDRDLLGRWVAGYAEAVTNTVLTDPTLSGAVLWCEWTGDDLGPVAANRSRTSLMLFGTTTFEAGVIEPAIRLENLAL